MKRLIRMCVGVFVAVSAAGSAELLATTDQRVLIWGKVTETERQSEQMRNLARNRDRVCRTMNHAAVNDAWNQAKHNLTNVFVEIGIPPFVQYEIEASVEKARDDFCNADLTPEQATSDDAFIVYSHCSMFMRYRDGGGNLSIWLQGGMNEAVMLVSDGTEAAASRINRDMRRVRFPQGEELIGAGRTTSTTMNQVAGPRAFDLGFTPEDTRSFDAYQYSYNYDSSLSGGMMGDAVDQAGATGMTQFPSLAAMTRVTTSGTAWVSPDVPGVEIVHAFYNNFAAIVEGQQGAMSFLGGMLRNQEVMTSKGIPLEYETTTRAAMGMTAYSTFKVRNVKVIPARVDECVAALPPGTQELDFGDAGLPPGGGAPPGLPPGSGSFPGGGGPGSAMPGLPSPSTGDGGAAGTSKQSGSGFGSVNPVQAQCADGLYSDNMTLMVQRMLDSLGYDVGGLDGKLGVQTMIAISEFQAEKGHKVTGEPSPQLAGILSAEVDKRCGN